VTSVGLRFHCKEFCAALICKGFVIPGATDG